MHRVHHFTSTRLAYDACFDDPHVREGDVLVIAREQIVGLASSDPIAVTTGHGYLRTIPAMSRDTLLAELAHDAAQLSHAVDEALRHHYPVAAHYLSFATSQHRLLAGETIAVLTADDLLVTSDAIDRRIANLRERMEGKEQESEGLFLADAIRRLETARGKLANPARTHPVAPTR